MTKGIARPVVGPDGVDYPSVRAAARALGQPPATLHRHLQFYGHLQNLEADMMRTPVRYKGVLYASVSECCRQTGLSLSAAFRHLRKYGHLENARVGKGWRGCKVKSRMKTKLGPWVFPSRVAAARELKIDISTLYRHLQGKATAGEKARMQERLNNYQPDPLSKDAAKNVRPSPDQEKAK